jgi:hypothetical protein
MKITELDLQKLGFSKVVVGPQDAGTILGYYYYELELSSCNTDFCLISMESDNIKEDTWYVKLFETDDYKFSDREELKSFIEAILPFKKQAEL